METAANNIQGVQKRLSELSNALLFHVGDLPPFRCQWVQWGEVIEREEEGISQFKKSLFWDAHPIEIFDCAHYLKL